VGRARARAGVPEAGDGAATGVGTGWSGRGMGFWEAMSEPETGRAAAGG